MHSAWFVGLAASLSTPLCGSTTPSGSGGGAGWIQVPSLGVQLQGPSDAKPTGTSTAAFVSNGSFELNLLTVIPASPSSAADQQNRLQNIEPSFSAFTTTQLGAATWRFDYTLDDSTAGTVSRIVVGGKPLDCGIHHVAAAIAAQVAAACATVKPL